MKILQSKIFIFLFINLFFLQFSSFIFAQNIDIDILKSTNINRNKNLDAGFHFLSDADIFVVIAAPTVLTSVGFLKKDSILTRKGLYVFASVATTFALTTAIKYAVHRQRPYITYPFLDNQSVESDYSFPSGHTSSAFGVATSVSLAFPKWYVIAPAYTWASLTAYSRLHLGVHYPSDVFAGALVGAGCAILTHHINKKIFKR